MKIRIRKGQYSDLSELAELYRKHFEYQVSLNPYYEIIDDFDWMVFARNKLYRTKGIVLAAVSEKTIAGFIDIRIVPNYKKKHKGRLQSVFRRLKFIRMRRWIQQSVFPVKPFEYGVIDNCYVVPELRRQGIGALLVNEAKTWFCRHNVRRIELGAAAQNAGALTFWKKAGFEPFRILCFSDIEKQ